jgi:hypothetical protein
MPTPGLELRTDDAGGDFVTVLPPALELEIQNRRQQKTNKQTEKTIKG